MQNFWKRAILQTLFSCVCATALCLFSVAIFALIIRAFAPSDTAIILINQLIKNASILLCSAIFIKGERSLFQGAAAGACAVLLTMLVFGIIGGFHLRAIFLIELLLGAVFGATGALCSKKLRKE